MWYTVGMPKKPTSIRLSDEARRLKAKLAKKLGIDETAVIEMGIRKLANTEGVK